MCLRPPAEEPSASLPHWTDHTDRSMDKWRENDFIMPNWETRARLAEILIEEFTETSRLAAEGFRVSRNDWFRLGRFIVIWDWLVPGQAVWPRYADDAEADDADADGADAPYPLPMHILVGDAGERVNLGEFIQQTLVLQPSLLSQTDARFELSDGRFKFSYVIIKLEASAVFRNVNQINGGEERFPSFEQRLFPPLVWRPPVTGSGGSTLPDGQNTDTNKYIRNRLAMESQIRRRRRITSNPVVHL